MPLLYSVVLRGMSFVRYVYQGNPQVKYRTNSVGWIVGFVPFWQKEGKKVSKALHPTVVAIQDTIRAPGLVSVLVLHDSPENTTRLLVGLVSSSSRQVCYLTYYGVCSTSTTFLVTGQRRRSTCGLFRTRSGQDLQALRVGIQSIPMEKRKGLWARSWGRERKGPCFSHLGSFARPR